MMNERSWDDEDENAEHPETLSGEKKRPASRITKRSYNRYGLAIVPFRFSGWISNRYGLSTSLYWVCQCNYPALCSIINSQGSDGPELCHCVSRVQLLYVICPGIVFWTVEAVL
ncbi:hypothetical protein ACFXTI_038474 [Malus domestica]